MPFWQGLDLGDHPVGLVTVGVKEPQAADETSPAEKPHDEGGEDDHGDQSGYPRRIRMTAVATMARLATASKP
jgi:hypothetical protein